MPRRPRHPVVSVVVLVLVLVFVKPIV